MGARGEDSLVPRVSGLSTDDRFEGQYFNAAIDGTGARPCPPARVLDSELGPDWRGGEEAWEKLWPPHALASPLRGTSGAGCYLQKEPAEWQEAGNPPGDREKRRYQWRHSSIDFLL